MPSMYAELIMARIVSRCRHESNVHRSDMITTSWRAEPSLSRNRDDWTRWGLRSPGGVPATVLHHGFSGAGGASGFIVASALR